MADRLEGAGAVLVEGAKWCGKTTTCELISLDREVAVPAYTSTYIAL